jgi:carbonic anhydrase
MEFACKLAGKGRIGDGPHIVWCHQGCDRQRPTWKFTALLARIRPAVTHRVFWERSAKNYGFVDAVARKNIELTMTDIHRSAVFGDGRDQDRRCDV